MSEHTDHERITAGRGAYWRDARDGWCYACSGLLVPGAQDVLDDELEIVSMIAPELAPDLLLGIPDMAARYGVAPSYISADQAKGRMPTAPVKVANCPAWTAPIADWWWTHRPGRGVHDPIPPGYRTIEEAAGLVERTPTTVRAWTRQGRLASEMVGRRRLIPDSAIDAYLADNGGQPSAQRGRGGP